MRQQLLLHATKQAADQIQRAQCLKRIPGLILFFPYAYAQWKMMPMHLEHILYIFVQTRHFHTYAHTHMYIYMYICIHVCVCVCIYIYMMHVCVFKIHICTHIHIRQRGLDPLGNVACLPGCRNIVQPGGARCRVRLFFSGLREGRSEGRFP